jgi:beta-N-acetylhexosaminidase
MPGVRGEDLAEVGQTLIDEHVGGILVMTWPEGLTADDLAPFHAGAVPMLLAVDEEGGDVQRLRRLGRLPAAADVAATMTPAEAQQLVADHAQIVAALGFDVVFAPVVDVGPAGGGGPIGDRSFGDDSDIVTDYASAYVAAWKSAGILPVLKHFPGHGRATADSHNGTSITPPLAELNQIDLFPYRALVGSGSGVMVGHLDVPGLTEPGLPASLSPAAITGLLRGQLGYLDALVFTDALGMGAIAERFTVTDAAVRAIAAGADVALVGSPADVPPVIDALAAAVDAGTITHDRLAVALTDVLTAKHLLC